MKGRALVVKSRNFWFWFFFRVIFLTIVHTDNFCCTFYSTFSLSWNVRSNQRNVHIFLAVLTWAVRRFESSSVLPFSLYSSTIKRDKAETKWITKCLLKTLSRKIVLLCNVTSFICIIHFSFLSFLKLLTNDVDDIFVRKCSSIFFLFSGCNLFCSNQEIQYCFIDT